MSTEIVTATDEPEDEAPFLDTAPPPWAAGGLAYVMILLFVAVVLTSAFLRVPETVTSPFVLMPVRGADALRTDRSGVVKDVPVVEGQTVSRGATMFVIRSRDVGDRFSELETLENQLENSSERLANARRKHESQQRADEEEARRLDAARASLGHMHALRREQLAVTEEQFERSKKLADEGLASWSEHTNHRMRVNQTRLELQQLETEQRDNLAAIEKLRHDSAARVSEFRELERSLRESAATSGFRARALSGDLAGSAGLEFAVRAPCPGTVLKLEARRPGAVVREGDVLGEIACAGERLQAELTVPQSGLAKIRQGQPVKLLYDAFPYQRYGVRYGTVRWTSPATVTIGQTPAFRVFVQLANETIPVDGQARTLMPGMGGRARIVVGRRSVISYALAPLRQLRENMAVAPRKESP
ncbi:MAG TPA: HlyD family efflux transporter periplasmic adaptor subunit [Thermoanaerobaculia bacterium]|nr:HlyD family efflux transporter periplasmic adaptor subunit [Thermoanaerobaculia bacterium]